MGTEEWALVVAIAAAGFAALGWYATSRTATANEEMAESSRQSAEAAQLSARAAEETVELSREQLSLVARAQRPFVRPVLQGERSSAKETAYGVQIENTGGGAAHKCVIVLIVNNQRVSEHSAGTVPAGTVSTKYTLRKPAEGSSEDGIEIHVEYVDDRGTEYVAVRPFGTNLFVVNRCQRSRSGLLQKVEQIFPGTTD